MYDDPDKLFDAGVALLESHDFSKAIDCFEELNRKYPDDLHAPRDSHILNVLEIAHHLKEKWEEAKGDRKIAREYFGNDIDIDYDSENPAITKNLDLIMAIKMLKPTFLVTCNENIPPYDNCECPDGLESTDDTEIVSSTEVNEPYMQFADLLKFQQQLANDFEIKLKYDAAKQEQIDKLYKENLEYKDGILEKFRRQLILAVIEQIDECQKSAEFFATAEYSEENYIKLLRFFREIAADFQNMLYEQFDVVAYHSEPLTTLDVKRQRPLRTTPTDDESQHRLVKQSLKPGYQLGDKVLRHEMVDVYSKNSCQSRTL